MKQVNVRDRFSADFALGLLTGKFPKQKIEAPKCDACGGARFAWNPETRNAGPYGSCPACKKALENWNFESNAERSKGAIVNMNLLEGLANSKIILPEILDLANKGPAPVFLVGPTGTGKSLLLRYFYNRLIRNNRGVAGGVLFVSEAQLFRIFREDETNETFTAFCHRARDKHDDYFVIIPDAFRAKQYEGRDSGRHYSSIAWDNYFEWLDAFVLDRDVKLCIAANVSSKAVLNFSDPREAAIERRLREQSGGKITWLETDPENVG